MSYDIIGAVGVGIVGQTPPGTANAMSSSYLFRYAPAKGSNTSLVYDTSGKGKDATINGSIVVNGRTITSTLTPAEAWASTGLTLGSAAGKLPVLDPSVISNYRPDQGDSMLLVARMYIPSVPATGSTVTLFGAMGRNASSQNNGFRFALTCLDGSLPRTIQFISYDGTGSSKFSGNSTGTVSDASDVFLAWYVDPTLARVRMWVNDVASWGGNNNVYMRNFYTDILTSTTAQTPPFGIGGGQYDLGVGVPNAVIKQVDFVVVKGRGITNVDAAVSKMKALPGTYLTEQDLV